MLTARQTDRRTDSKHTHKHIYIRTYAHTQIPRDGHKENNDIRKNLKQRPPPPRAGRAAALKPLLSTRTDNTIPTQTTSAFRVFWARFKVSRAYTQNKVFSFSPKDKTLNAVLRYAVSQLLQ